MTPKRGWLYQSANPRTRAEAFLVLSEDDWNAIFPDVVAVPVWQIADASPNDLRVAIGPKRFCECTRVSSIGTGALLGPAVGSAAPGVMTAVEAGVRAYLCIPQLLARGPCTPASGPRTASSWWPGQGEVRYTSPPIAGKHKLHSPLTEDAWNEVAPHWTTVRLTSVTGKKKRKRWEVPVTGGCVVSGDLFLTPRGAMDAKPPKPPRPNQLTTTELAEVAQRLAATLLLY